MSRKDKIVDNQHRIGQKSLLEIPLEEGIGGIHHTGQYEKDMKPDDKPHFNFFRALA